MTHATANYDQITSDPIDPIEELNQGLQSIDINVVDDNYNLWLSISRAYCDAGGDYSTWDAWCSNGANYDARNNAYKWNDFTKKPGTSVQEARNILFSKAYSIGNFHGNRSNRSDAAKRSQLPRKEPQMKLDCRFNLDVKHINFSLTQQESREDTVTFLKALYEPTDYVGIITNAYLSQKQGKWEPRPDNHEVHYTCQYLIDNIDQIYDSYYRYNISAGSSGIWCRVNPMKERGGSDADVASYKYVLIESDEMPLQDQVNLIYALRLPVATLTYSGDKSVHALVKVDAEDLKEYDARVDFVYNVCNTNGLKLDDKCRNESRMTRLAGPLRDGKCQKLIATNIGDKDYEEWHSWIIWQIRHRDDDVVDVEEDAVEDHPEEETVTKSKFRVFNASEYMTSGDYDKSLNYFASYKTRKTGFENLDGKDEYDDKRLTLYPGLMALGGGASVGKTTFAINLVDNLLDQGETVLYFALEQEPVELITKQLAKNLRQKYGSNAISNIRIKNGETNKYLEEIKREYAEKYRNFHIIRCNFNATSDDVTKYVEDFIKSSSIRPIVIIDYLQLLGTPIAVRGDVRERLDYNVKQLKTMQVENELLVIMISNINRSSYQDPISYDSFKESGLIEFTCDYMLGLQLAVLSDPDYLELGEKKKSDKRLMVKTAQEQNPKRVQVVVLKNRNGKQRFSAYFDYNMAFDLFEPIDDPYDEADKW